MPSLGSFAVLLALLVSLYGSISAFMAAKDSDKRTRLGKSAQRTILASFGLLSIASLCLIELLATKDLRVEYVASHVSKDLPIFYTLTAFWAGQAGSLLLWAWMIALMGVLSLLTFRKSFELPLNVSLYAYHVILAVLVFFLALVAFVTSPFALLPFTPAEGLGLNAQLQHPIMAIHPPTLYLGYISATVPYAIALGMLLAKSDDPRAYRAIRIFCLGSWGLLTVGNLLGANWAYETLGWGGFWAWDPVENAGLLPWLTLSALLHTMLLQSRTGLLKKWNLFLLVLSFGLTIFGTFLTRSGIISSVHAFVQNKTFTISFTAFLIASLAYGFGLIILRRGLLKAEKSLESVPLLSRPSALVFTCTILVAMMFTTFWGTVFPLVSGAFIGQKLSFGAAFFNKINAPLTWALLFTMGAGLFLPASPETFKRSLSTLLAPLVGGLVVGGLVGVAFGIQDLNFLIGTAFLGFSLIGLMKHALTSAFQGDLRVRRLGAILVHTGLLLALFGVFGQYGHTKQEVSLKKKESAKVGDKQLVFEGLAFKQNGPWITISSLLYLYKNGSFISSLVPSKTFLEKQEQPITRVAIRSRPSGDVYAVLAGYDFQHQQGVFEVHDNPLIGFLWLGGILMCIGGVFTLIPLVERPLEYKAQKNLHSIAS
mgnify:CR=1 FL=1